MIRDLSCTAVHVIGVNVVGEGKKKMAVVFTENIISEYPKYHWTKSAALSKNAVSANIKLSRYFH